MTTSMTKRITRREQLLPGGVPKYIRVYDNLGESIDRYTVVFTGRYSHLTGGETWVLAMNERPFHPQGFGQHCNTIDRPDRPRYGHLGVKIAFADLPGDCQRLVLQDYACLWDLDEGGPE